MSKQLSETGLNLIMRFGNCSLTAKQHPAYNNRIIVGYNHVVSGDIDINGTITFEEAEQFLREDCQKFVRYVNDAAYVPITNDLNQNQFDALVSFAFDCGYDGLKLLCKDRELHQISTAIERYEKSIISVLLLTDKTQRAYEQALFNMACDGVTETRTEFNTAARSLVSSNCLALQKAINADKVASLTEDGKAGPKTKKVFGKIKLGAVLNKIEGRWVTGSKGECVRFVQMRLGLPEDGLYGVGTRNGVIAWQIEHRLEPDGVVGPVTLMTMV